MLCISSNDCTVIIEFVKAKWSVSDETFFYINKELSAPLLHATNISNQNLDNTHFVKTIETVILRLIINEAFPVFVLFLGTSSWSLNISCNH